MRPLSVSINQAWRRTAGVLEANSGMKGSYHARSTITSRRTISSATSNNHNFQKRFARIVSSNLVSQSLPSYIAFKRQFSSGLWRTSKVTGTYEIRDQQPKQISLHLHDGIEAVEASYSNFWLRDNCRCSKCVNQDTMQRAFDTFSIPPDIKSEQVDATSEGLKITWSGDSHKSIYPWAWLLKHRPNAGLQQGKHLKHQKQLWQRDSSGNVLPPIVRYEDIMASDKGVGEWTANIYKYGFCFVDDCPVSPEKTQELLERIAFIRETHYGGFYDFTSDLTMKDTAYTSLALPAHTDTTYFSDPAGLQMFHMLSHTDGSGGHSLLVDGFEALSTLRREDYKAFEILCQVAIPAHASGNEGITITPYKHFPMFSYKSPDLMETEFPDMVRWNNDDRGVVPLKSYTVDGNVSADEWYAAASKWNEIIKRKEMEYWVKLEPGRALIFDNWRVMHGRSAFTGKRRMCGGYNDYISRWRNTNFSKEEVMEQIL